MKSACGVHSLSRLLATAALVAAMLSGSGGKAFAVVGTPETAQCTGKCETCIEYEVAKDGTQRCLKCGIAPNCLGNPGDPGLTSDFTDIVKEHNNGRKDNCANPLTWSPTAAASAQQYASTCPSNGQGGFNHDPQATYGENLAWGQGLSGTGAVDLWYAGKNQYNFANPEWSNAVGHFTQMVWKGSTEIGCGVAVCGGQNFWACRYSPRGNINVSTKYVTPEQARENLKASVGCAAPAAAPGAPPEPTPAPAAEPAPAPAPAPAPGGGGKAAQVIQDVDVYDAPGGNGNQIGVLNAGGSVTLLGDCADSWCNVQGAAVPTGQGWVYDGADYDSLKY